MLRLVLTLYCLSAALYACSSAPEKESFIGNSTIKMTPIVPGDDTGSDTSDDTNTGGDSGSDSGDGGGPGDGVIEIYDIGDLEQIREDSAREFKLMADLDFSLAGNFSPLPGTDIIFDGNGFSILGLRVVREGDNNIGFFSQLIRAHVQNLSFVNTIARGENHIGVLAGRIIDTEVKNVDVISAEVYAIAHAGGLIGRSESSYIRNSSVDNAHLEFTVNFAGGIVGYARESHLTDLRTSNIRIEGNTQMGGIVGGVRRDSTLLDASAIGLTIIYTGTNTSYLGGAIGRCTAENDESFPVINDFYVKNAVLRGRNYMGGFAGSLENCIINRGYVTNTEIDSYASDDSELDVVGGFVGRVHDSSSINEVYSQTEIKVTSLGDNQRVAAFAGMYLSPFPITGVNSIYQSSDMIGALIDNETYAHPKTESEMQMRSTYEAFGWDFNSYWQITPNSPPTLQ